MTTTMVANTSTYEDGKITLFRVRKWIVGENMAEGDVLLIKHMTGPLANRIKYNITQKYGRDDRSFTVKMTDEKTMSITCTRA